MSVVVAIKKDGIIYMGADSQVTKGGTRTTLSNPNNYKIWRMSRVKGCIMGSVGNLCAANVIMVAEDLIPEITDIKNEVDFKFVVKKFVPNLMGELELYGLMNCSSGTNDMGAGFLLAYHDRLFNISQYGAVIEVDDFCAIGSGSSEAIGSLLSTMDENDPTERIKAAIKSSATHDIYVDYPIVISDTKTTEFKVYYEKDI